MGKLILKKENIKRFLLGGTGHARDAAGRYNQFSVARSVAAEDSTTFDSDAMEREPSILDGSASFSGLVEDSDPMFEIIDGVNKLVFSAPLNGGDADEDPVVFARCIGSEWSGGGAVGKLFEFSLNLPPDGALVKGMVVDDATQTAETAAGNGGEISLGAVAAGETLYAAIFITELDATDITFVLESDATGFAAPTDRITFAAATGVGAQFLSVAGPITDDHVRIKWTGTGLNSVKFYAVAGIV